MQPSTSKRSRRAYAVARRFEPLLVNSVVGFIGPEYLYDSKQIIRAGLEDHFCGKLLGVPMGCDVCYTNHTDADQDDMDSRLALDRSGSSLATTPMLDFRLAHVRARDAVNETIDIPRLAEKLADLEWPIVTIDSAAPDRSAYLLLPDLGRSLGPKAQEALLAHAGAYRGRPTP